ncbi:hypothetical protein L7F22_049513 [Adiantum nelumboides]|nr:hypothetical protein [Adiantum nelumboides]
MEADVPLPSHMHGTSRMPDEYMRLLCKSDPKSYHELKKQYEMDFDKVHEEYNDVNDMDDNDMDEFINDWYAGDDIAGEDESFLRAKALQQIYKGSKLSRLSASLLILNLQNRYAWSNASVLALFKWITSKEIDISSIAQKKRECIELLCLMEKKLSTSFFDIQVHVLIHLVDEIEIAGVVSTRWTFWIERFMGVLKGLVRQRARPEGSMSEGWVLRECMYYLVDDLERIDEGAPCKWTLDKPTILSDEILCGKGICFKVSYEERTNLSTFVIYNSQCMEKFVEKYHEVISNAQGTRRGEKSSKTEPLSILGWLSHRIKDEIMKGEVISDEQREIGLGCDREVHGYTNMWSYGQHRRVNRIDRKHQTQDLCIISFFKQQSCASARDTHLIEEKLGYVGTIAGIYELGYRICKRVVLKVDWFCVDYKGARATMRQECFGFWSVDSSKPLRVTREPYILPAHCEQSFFYAAPYSNSPWRQVVPINPQGHRIFDTTYMEADQDSLHEDEPTSTKPLQLTTLAQEEPQEEAVDNNDGVDDETEDLAMDFDFEPHQLEERPSIDVPPTLALDLHLTIKELQETIQDNEETELIIDLFLMND